MWTIEEAAEYISRELNAPVTVRALRYWRTQGRGPEGVRVGKFLRYPRVNVEAYVRETMGDEPGSES